METADVPWESEWHAPTALTIYEVADTAMDEALADLARHAAILDLGELGELDTAGAQWLLLAQQLLARQGLALTLTGVAPRHREQLERLGLAAQLMPSAADCAATPDQPARGADHE